MRTFKSFASIHNSVNSPLFWMNLIFVGAAGFLFDLTIKSIKYIFFPKFCRELKIVFNKYGPIDSTENLSDNIKNKLLEYKEREENDNNQRRNETDEEANGNLRIIQIQSLNNSNN